jgi:MFS family permease
MSAIIAAHFFSALDESTRNIFVLLALMVILGTRTYFGEKEFADWAWRVPYALSGILLVISIWIRLKLNESPAFSKMKAEDKTSNAP